MHFVVKPLDSMARRPLAICAASLFAIASPMALATTYPVTSCKDDGSAGTLRSAIALAVNDGDVVDLTTLTVGDTDCSASTITLQTGGSHIVIPDNITIMGDPNHTWTVDGSQLDSNIINASNVFYHTGTGTLEVDYLKVTGGHESHMTIPGLGGCIYSSGSVYLKGSTVTGCTVYSEYATAKGAGIYAKNGVTLTASGIYSNTASGPTALGGGTYSGGSTILKYGSNVVLNTATGYNTAKGGGIYAAGSVTAAFPTPPMSPYGTNAAVIGNNVATATGTNGRAYGGGIYAKLNVNLNEGLVKYNSAHGPSVANGGGIFTTGDLTVNYTTVTGNVGSGSAVRSGGGIHASGNVYLTSSTISNNSAYYFGGIDAFSFSPDGKTFMLSNSTISGNSASGRTGAAYSNLQSNKFYNSTVAFNTAGNSYPGIEVSGYGGSPKSVLLQGTLMSNNTYGSSENDFANYAPYSGNVLFNVASSHNLVRATFESIPGNTTGLCPLLGPLRNNGGLTQTHALLSTSPAIDQGNDALAIGYDQRGQASVNGTMDYLRPSGGADTMPDIGAYEVQKSDIVFNAGFDGCVPLF